MMSEIWSRPAHDPVRIPQLRQVEESSRVLDVEIKVFPVIDASDDIERTITAAVEWKADAVFRIAAQGAVIFAKLQADLLLRNRLPGMFINRIDVEHGGLMSYVADFSEHWNQVADYVDRILKGASPGELSGCNAHENSVRAQPQDRASVRSHDPAWGSCDRRRLPHVLPPQGPGHPAIAGVPSG